MNTEYGKRALPTLMSRVLPVTEGCEDTAFGPQDEAIFYRS